MQALAAKLGSGAAALLVGCGVGCGIGLIAGAQPLGWDPLPAPAVQDERPVPGLGTLPKGVPAEEEGLGVNIVRANGGGPLGSVKVRYAVQSTLDELQAEDPNVLLLDDEELLARSPLATTTNSQGWALLSSMKGTMIVDCRSENLYGSVRIDRTTTSHVRIELFPDAELVVDTRSKDGAKQVGVPIVLMDETFAPLWRASTGSDGRAQLKHVHARLQQRRPHADLWVAVDAPRADPPPQRLPFGAIPAEPVRFALEPGGIVSIAVEDIDGKPCAEAAHVELALPGDPRSMRTRVLERGSATFHWVPLGARFEVLVRDHCGPDVLARTLTGPHAVGTLVGATLRSRERMPRISVRALDAVGDPLAGWTIEPFLAQPGANACERWLPQRATRADADGRVLLSLPDWKPDSASRVQLVASNDSGRKPSSEPLELEATSATSTPDLGALRLRDWPSAVAGHVVDDAGMPVQGAEVVLLRTASDGSACEDARVATVSDARGAFTLRAPLDAAPLRVRARIVHHAREIASDAELERGARDARLILLRNGTVVGSLLVPDSTDARFVEVRIGSDPGSYVGAAVNDDGTFTMGSVPPGRTRVAIHVVGFQTPLLTIDDVEVPLGGTTSDPRLEKIDLRELVRVLEVEVVDENGAPVMRGSAGPAQADGHSALPFAIIEGRVQLALPKGASAVEFLGAGYAALRVPISELGSRVVLSAEKGTR